MAEQQQKIDDIVPKEYSAGFVTDIEADSLPPGLSEDVVREISRIKGEPEFLTEWRLEAYRYWLTLETPDWAHVHYPEINYQDISYYSAPKKKNRRA
jgi:Fe-S cluster assembly protein SufB